MANKAERMLKNIEDICGNEVYNDLVDRVGVIGEKSTPAKQGKYMRSLLDELSSEHGVEIAKKVMGACGHQCISENIIKTAKTLYKNAENIDGFLKLLNENHIGGGYLHMEANKIIGVYDRCYCGVPKASKDISPIYCQCSAGWFEKLFSSVFEKAVKVTLVDTILNGANKCTFEVLF